MMDEQEVRNCIVLYLERCRKWTGDNRTEPCNPNSRMVANVMDMMKTLVSLAKEVDPPCWLAGATSPGSERPPADEMIPVANGLLHGLTGVLWPLIPDFFSTTVSPVSYTENALKPDEWLRFLSLLWPDDPRSIETLQEWFGYCLVGNTSLQKILMVAGPPRSGKGTIARFLLCCSGLRTSAVRPWVIWELDSGWRR